MYIPPSFKQEDQAKLCDFIRHFSFGILCQGTEGNITAGHFPFLLDEKEGKKGILKGHMAMANPLWKDLDGREVLVVFTGPHAYISPSWYGVSEAVPTWNYVSVHVYGKYHAIKDEGEVIHILEKLVSVNEARLPQPWKIESLSKEYYLKLSKMIVGFKIEISRIEGNWKLSQNHSLERRQNVVRALESSDALEDKVMADWMKK